MKYIGEHYFHYRAAEQTEILGKARKTLGKAEERLDWIEELPNANKAKVTTVTTNSRPSSTKKSKVKPRCVTTYPKSNTQESS